MDRGCPEVVVGIAVSNRGIEGKRDGGHTKDGGDEEEVPTAT